MSRAALGDLTGVLERDLPRLRACAAALTGDLTGADALLAQVLERVVAAWPRYARSPDPGAAVREELVRRGVRVAPAGAAAAHQPYDSQAEPLRVLGALAGLPVRQRALLVLRDLSGAPVERAAAVLRVPVAVAEAEHRAAVAALGRALGEELLLPVEPEVADPPGRTGRPGHPVPAGSVSSADQVVDLSAPDGAA